MVNPQYTLSVALGVGAEGLKRRELYEKAASVEHLQRFCIRLSRALIAKGLFSKKEMIDLIFEYPGATWGTWDPGPKELDTKCSECG